MQPGLSREELDAMDDAALIWACAGPVILRIRGRSFGVKAEALASLSPTVRALVLCQVVYGHAHEGVIGFYCGTSYLLAQPGMWRALRRGPEYFGDMGLSQLIGEMESLYYRILEKYKGLRFDGVEEALEAVLADPALAENMRKLDEELAALLPESVKLVAGYIRVHDGEFRATGAETGGY